MSTEEIIEQLQLLKSEIEWDYSIHYQIVLDSAINKLRMINKPSFKNLWRIINNGEKE